MSWYQVVARYWPTISRITVCALIISVFVSNSSLAPFPAGEPYKVRYNLLSLYVVVECAQYVGGDANTVPFNLAPAPVCNARHLIEKRVKQALDIPVTFNEVLRSVEYLSLLLYWKALKICQVPHIWRDKKWLYVLKHPSEINLSDSRHSFTVITKLALGRL